MTATDLVLLAVIGLSMLFGLMRGFVGVVVSLVAWVLAAWASFHFGASIALLLAGGHGTPSPGQLFAGYGLSFLCVLLVVGIVGWIVRKLVHAVGLSGVDRALGLALGAVRGGFVACLLVLLMGFTAMPREPGWRDSQVVPVLLPGARLLSGLLPSWAARQVDFGPSRNHPLVPGDALALPQPGA